MRKLSFLLLFLFSFSVLSAQEKLSKEEKARREKNIQAGNPFAKYGSKAPVATLSKGKYLEVHDLDSIVTIGTSRWHVDNKKIVGDIVIDSINVDAQPVGDTPGRWMSVDPLTEETPNWSPYVAFNNNPVYYTDPTGMSSSPIYDELGAFLGTDSEGFKGEAIFMNRSTFNLNGGYNNGTDGSQKGGISHETAMALGQTADQVIGDGGSSDFTQGESDMLNNAINHIVSETKDTRFKMSELHHGKTSSYFAVPDTSTSNGMDYSIRVSNDGSSYDFRKPDVPAYQDGNKMVFNLTSSLLTGKGQFTVNNIQNTSIHEGDGHMKGNIPGKGKIHAGAYQLQMNHSTWNGTTPLWKAKLSEAKSLIEEGKL